jgi:hypothetical protein
MNHLDIVIILGIAVSGLLLWLLIPRRGTSNASSVTFPTDVNDSLPGAKHYGYLPQILQALSVADSKYLRENSSSNVARQAIHERRKVVRQFLQGLHEDFSNLARLGRIIAALSPEVSRQQETERLILSLKFQLVYALVWLRLSTGNVPVRQLQHLAGLVGRLAKRMDEAMAEISALSAGQVRGALRT